MNEINKVHEKAVVASQLNKEREYWLNKLSGAGAKSRFLYDYEKKSQESESLREAIRFQLTGESFSKLMKLSNQSDIRLHMIMISALVLLLQRYNSSNDILLASPVLKQEENLEFINTVLILRAELTPGMTYKELLLQVRQTIIEATDNQNYPVQTLPDQLGITFTAADDFPLAEVAALVENIHDKKYIQPIDPKIIFSFLRTAESIEGTIEYKVAWYTQGTVERIASHFKTVLDSVTANVDLSIEAIEILSSVEKKQLLIDFNSFARESGADRCIHHLIEEQVTRTPYHNALVFEHEQVTYEYMNERANRLAKYLKTLGVGDDSIVAIMVERSLEMITGILAILKAGGAYLPIEPASPREKITYMLDDSAAAVLIYKGKKENNENFVESVRNLRVVDITNAACYSQQPGNTGYGISPFSAAYIIYTSGTTGNPKGVIVGHRQTVNTLVCRKEEYGMDSSVTSLQLFSYVFDGFVTSFFTPVISGAKTILLPDEGIMDINWIKKTITRHYVTHFISVPSLYSVIIENLGAAEAAYLKVITLAGDNVSSSIIEASRIKNPGIEIVNEYGVTEAAVMSTIYRRQGNDPQIKIGHPIWNTRIYILDKQGRLQPIGIPGELCIAGLGTARGYLNRPELTVERFKKDFILQLSLTIDNKSILNDQWPMSNDRFYKTGDMGRWLPDGNLQLLGRIDYQVKIRGFRIEPGEIENRLLSCPGVKETIVLTKENETGDKMLLAFFVPNRPLDIPLLREYLSKTLPAYMIPAHFVELEQMPLTPTGKIDRKKLLQLSANIKLEAEYLPPRNSIEEQLVDIWQGLLKLEKVGVNDNFFNIGGDSIKTISLLNLINKEFKVELKTVDLYENDTIRKIAEKIVNFQEIAIDENKEQVLQEIAALKNSVLAKTKIARIIEDIYPLSDIEKGMIYYYLRNPGTPVYHNQLILQWKMKNFDQDIFRKTLELMIKKHPNLRSGYSIYDYEEPVHIVFNEIPYDFDCFDITQLDETGKVSYINSIVEKDRGRHFIFDGEKPLWRMNAFILDKDTVCFLWSCHHAMIDGWSSASLMTEVNNTYIKLKAGEDVTLEKLKNTYKEFVIEQMMGKRDQRMFDYWKKELEGYKKLQLPGRLVNAKEKARFKRLIKYFQAEYLGKLSNASRTYNTSVKHLCFAAYIYMLNMLTYDKDVAVGLVTNNRPVCEDSEKIFGCFLNTVPVRMHVHGRIKCSDYIDRIEKKMVELKKYDKLSLFEIKRIIGEENQNENPIFDTVFNFIDFYVLGELEKEGEQPGIKTPAPEERQVLAERGANMNTLLDVHISTTGGQFSLVFNYASHIISDEWAVKLGGYFETILNKFIEAPGEYVDKADFISREEKQKLLLHFNNTRMEWPLEKTIIDLFEEQERKIPGHIAILHRDMQLTYSNLDEKSIQIAKLLQEKGVKCDTIVGIMMESSIEMIIGIMGILKVGGAYLPIDPQYPQERIDYMLKDSGAGIMIDRAEFVFSCFSVPSPFPRFLVNPSSLAYIVYTSGTTGKPKGVMIDHRSIFNTIYWRMREYNMKPGDRALQLFSVAFDGFLTSFFTPVVSGAMVVLLGGEEMKNVVRVKETIISIGITHFICVPSLYRVLLEICSGNELLSLKTITLAGEQIYPGIIEKSKEIHVSLEICNEYGPTEGSVVTTFCPDIHPGGVISIGKPIANVNVHIIDCYDNLSPIGIAGQLLISGSGLARGYLNQPELTAEKFIKNYRSDESNKANICYRSGDFARWLDDGTIEFLGRIDQQVKIRGYRVEIGEIEMRLTAHPRIKEAVVICREDALGNKYLCTYIVRRGEISEELGDKELRDYLSRTLPEYMIPAYYIQLEKIPLTANGKIDRKALPAPEIKIRKGYLAPRNESETKLAEIWAKVLRVEKDVIGIESNFFEMGGNSLNLIIMLGEIYKEFKIYMPFAQIIENPRIMDVANFITKNNLYEQVVVLLNQKRQKNVFCFPDQMGFGYGYGNLASLMEHYSFYSLTFIEDEDRLNQYVDIIKGIQPTGPYVFFGHSAAGRLTYMVASALEKRGYEVSDIIFADCVFLKDDGFAATEEYLATFRVSVSEFLKNLNAEFLIEKVFNKAKKYLNYYININSLEKVNANVHLIISEEIQKEAPEFHIRSWENLTTKTYKIYKGWGTHRGMLRGSDLEKNIEIIKNILDGIEFGAK